MSGGQEQNFAPRDREIQKNCCVFRHSFFLVFEKAAKKLALLLSRKAQQGRGREPKRTTLLPINRWSLLTSRFAFTTTASTITVNNTTTTTRPVRLVYNKQRRRGEYFSFMTKRPIIHPGILNPLSGEVGTQIVETGRQVYPKGQHTHTIFFLFCHQRFIAPNLARDRSCIYYRHTTLYTLVNIYAHNIVRLEYEHCCMYVYVI